VAVLMLAGCSRGIESKEAVRQAIIDHLSKRSDLSIGSMNVEVTSVSFKPNEAVAMVAFSPKGTAAGQGMSMRYTLEKQGSQWVVKGRADSGQEAHGGAGAVQPPSGDLPAGHPPVSGQMPGEKKP
jgi:hypothetical protein